MNLQVNIKWLIVISTIVGLVSCKPKYNVGIPKEPQDNIGAFFHDTLTLETSVVWNDSIGSTIAARTPFLMAGQYQDSYFGKLTAESYTSLFMPSGPNLSTMPVLDSAVMTLVPYALQDSTTRDDIQKVEVYEIDQNQTWIPTKYYVFSQALNIKPVDLAEGRFTFSYPSFAKAKFARARLNNEFGNKLLSLMQLTNEDLLNVFPGIAIKGMGNKMYTYRGIDTTNKITLYYKDITGRPGVQRFVFDGDSTGFYRIMHNWSGTNLASLNENNREISTKNTQNLCYVQSGIGLYTKVRIPYLKSLLQGRSVLVNKAELIVTCPDADEGNLKFAFRPFLSVYELKDLTYPLSSNMLAVQVGRQGNSNVALYDVGYNVPSKGYKFDITTYVQKALYNNTIDNGLLIGANKATNFVIGRAVFYDNAMPLGNPAVNNNNRMKLNIYYTIVD